MNFTFLVSAQISKTLAKNNNFLITCLILATLILILPASYLQIDSSGVSFTIADSKEYKDYQAFVESFGTDDYILLAIKNDLDVSDPELIKRVNKNMKLQNGMYWICVKRIISTVAI